MITPVTLPVHIVVKVIEMRRNVLIFILGLSVGLSLPAQAKMVEEVIQVAVKVADTYGKLIEQEVVVTVSHEDTLPPPYRIAIFNHGRSVLPEERLAFGRGKFSVNSRWLTSLGFLVAVPTRIGYGVTGGEDIEDTGSCDNKNYPPGYEAAAVQMLAVLDVLKQRSDTIKDRTLFMGQSFGGATAITLAAKNPPGVQAAINFAGGGGGNPKTQPGRPCGTVRLKRMFAAYGDTARIPTLWIYSENDQWMGSYPREWFDAFKEKGGVGELIVFPPHGADGHFLFNAAPEVWRPAVLNFLRVHGYPELKM